MQSLGHSLLLSLVELSIPVINLTLRALQMLLASLHVLVSPPIQCEGIVSSTIELPRRPSLSIASRKLALTTCEWHAMQPQDMDRTPFFEATKTFVPGRRPLRNQGPSHALHVCTRHAGALTIRMHGSAKPTT